MQTSRPDAGRKVCSDSLKRTYHALILSVAQTKLRCQAFAQGRFSHGEAMRTGREKAMSIGVRCFFAYKCANRRCAKRQERRFGDRSAQVVRPTDRRYLLQALIQCGIHAVLFQKFLVRAFLTDHAAFDHGDAVCVTDGGEAVRHHDGGSAAAQAVKGALDL